MWGGGGVNYFKFGTFDGRFPSDGAASMCSERVNILITAALNGERWKGPPGGGGGGGGEKKKKKEEEKKKLKERLAYGRIMTSLTAGRHCVL